MSGCNDESEIIAACNTVSTYDDEWSMGNIIVYPLPASNFFSIDFEESNIMDAHIRLVDIAGQELLSSLKADQNMLVEFDLNGINAGLYIIEISFDKHRMYKKLIVSR